MALGPFFCADRGALGEGPRFPAVLCRFRMRAIHRYAQCSFASVRQWITRRSGRHAESGSARSAFHCLMGTARELRALPEAALAIALFGAKPPQQQLETGRERLVCW